MPINLQPAFTALPAYRPVAFETFLSSPDPTVIENAVVDIYNGPDLVVSGIIYKSSRNEPSAFPLSTDYFFEIDIQKYIQDLLAPNKELPSTFPPNTTLGSALNDDMFGLFSIRVTYQYIDSATGILTDFAGAPEVSNQFYVYSIARQSTAPYFEVMNLGDLIGGPLLLNTMYLTKSEYTQPICADENAFLSLIQPNIGAGLTGFEVQLFDSNGVLLSEGQAGTNVPPFSLMQTLNTGITSLSGQTYVTGAPNFSVPALAYYTVSFGFLILVAGPAYVYIQQTPDFTYNVKANCCDRKSLRLHWMNLLGGTDSYTFTKQKVLGLETASDTARASLPWEIGSVTPHNVSDVGEFKTSSEASPFYDLISDILTNTTAEWLSTLFTSPKVYAEINGQFVPVRIEPNTWTINSSEGKLQYELTVIFSNGWIIQRS